MELLSKWKWKQEFGTARTVVSDKEEYSVRELMESGIMLLDTETTGVDHKRSLRLVQVGWKNKAWLLDPVTNNALIRDIMDSQAIFICHNIAFDLVTLSCWRYADKYAWALDKVLKNQAYCTMVAEQIITSNARQKSMSALAGEEGVPNIYEDEFNDRADKLGISHDEKYAKFELNDPYYLRYSVHDIFQLWAVYKRLREHFSNDLVIKETQCSVLFEILKHRGMAIDLKKADELDKELGLELAKYKRWLVKKDIVKINSGDQVASALMNSGAKLKTLTPTGKTKVDKGVLESIKKPAAANVIAVRVLKARSLAKDQASINNLKGNAVKDRVYPTLWRIGAVTGRSSCSTPNLQQLNKHAGDKRVRGLLMADEGHRLGSVDYDGLELRVIADLSKDKGLISHLRDGADIHGELARQVFGKKYTDKQRNQAKTGIFAMLFGAKDKSIAIQVKFDVEEASALREAWQSQYPKVAKYSIQIAREANQTGHTVLPNGWQPSVGFDKRGNIAGYKAVNYQIQGMAAFLVRAAAVQLARTNLFGYIRMLVHDEFVSSMPIDDAESIIEEIAVNARVETKRMVYTTSKELYQQHWGE